MNQNPIIITVLLFVLLFIVKFIGDLVGYVAKKILGDAIIELLERIPEGVIALAVWLVQPASRDRARNSYADQVDSMRMEMGQDRSARRELSKLVQSLKFAYTTFKAVPEWWRRDGYTPPQAVAEIFNFGRAEHRLFTTFGVLTMFLPVPVHAFSYADNSARPWTSWASEAALAMTFIGTGAAVAFLRIRAGSGLIWSSLALAQWIMAFTCPTMPAAMRAGFLVLCPLAIGAALVRELTPRIHRAYTSLPIAAFAILLATHQLWYSLQGRPDSSSNFMVGMGVALVAAKMLTNAAKARAQLEVEI